VSRRPRAHNGPASLCAASNGRPRRPCSCRPLRRPKRGGSCGFGPCCIELASVQTPTTSQHWTTGAPELVCLENEPPSFPFCPPLFSMESGRWLHLPCWRLCCLVGRSNVPIIQYHANRSLKFGWLARKQGGELWVAQLVDQIELHWPCRA